MASEGERPGESPNGISIAESIRKIAAKNARASLDDDEHLTRFLQSWWSRTYNRPLLDPLLQSYTLEQLLYEFYDRVERHAAEEERIKGAEIQQEENKEKADLDWADAEELKDREALRIKEEAASQESKEIKNPALDPENIKWMEEQIKANKEQFGETFGEDINDSFE